MNVVKIMGGLGNQLFQYAIAKHLEQADKAIKAGYAREVK